MRSKSKSKKVLETEKWVDSFINKHGRSPIYKEVMKKFNLSINGAWHRCHTFRGKMNNNTLKEGQTKYTRVRLEYLVPNLKFSEFTRILKQINDLLSKA